MINLIDDRSRFRRPRRITAVAVPAGYKSQHLVQGHPVFNAIAEALDHQLRIFRKRLRSGAHPPASTIFERLG